MPVSNHETVNPMIDNGMKPITTEQEEQCVTGIKDAARKSAEIAIAELKEKGLLNGENMQRILERGGYMSSKIQKSVSSLLTEMVGNAVCRLKSISGAETFVLDPTDGKEVLAEAESLFGFFFDDNFRNWNTDVKGEPTGVQHVQVYEMIENGNFEQIYGSFGLDLDALCLSQAQIIQFVKRYPKWIRADGSGVFFLFKVGGEFFVAGVCNYPNEGFGIHLFRVSRDSVWLVEYRHRFVVPQLIPVTT